MKKIFLPLILIVFGAVVGVLVFSNSARSVQEDQILKRQPIEEGVDRQSASAAHNYLYSCFSSDENGTPIFPDTYGGDYFPDEDKQLVIQLTTSDLSEYLFIQEEFPCVVFEQVKFSYNYLDELLREYLSTFDSKSETVYSGEVDMHSNRAIIKVNEETLSHKTNDPDSPVVFKLGSPYDFFLEFNRDPNDSSVIPFGVNIQTEPLSEAEQYDILDPVVNSQKTVTKIRGGDVLENRGYFGRSSKFFFTAGVGCTTSDGKNGLVASGHEMETFDFIFLDDTPIGIVSSVQCGSGNGDYCIITLGNNVIADGETHYINNVFRINHSVYEPKIGDKLFKCTRDKGYADLTVIAHDVKKYPVINGEYVEVKGLVKAKVTLGDAGKGDSGAGVYHNANDNTLSFLEFSGIIHGGEHENGELIAYFTPPKYIENCTIVCV